MNIQPALPQIKVKLDWKAYYKGFSEKHGGTPILYKGRQYFADGWSYSSTDYAGPEWPPPTDPKELATIQQVYWYTRWNRARNEMMVLRQRYDALKGLQETKDAPLQQVITDRNEETKKIERHVADWSPQVFEHIIAWLEGEVETANTNLMQIRASIKEPVPLKELKNGEPE